MITKYVKEYILDSIKKHSKSYDISFYNDRTICIKRDCYNIYIKPLISVMNGNRLISISIDQKICNIQVDKWLDIYWNIQSEYHKSLYANKIKKFHMENNEDSILLTSANIYDDLNLDGALYKFSQGPEQKDIDNMACNFLIEITNKIAMFFNKYNTQELMQEYIESRYINYSVYLISCMVSEDPMSIVDRVIDVRLSVGPLDSTKSDNTQDFPSIERKIAIMIDKIIYYCGVQLSKDNCHINIQEQINDIEYAIAYSKSENFFEKIKQELDKMCEVEDMYRYINQDNKIQRYQHIWFRRVGIFVFIFFIDQDFSKFNSDGALYYYTCSAVKLYDIDSILHDVLHLDIRKLSKKFYKHNYRKTTCDDPELLYRISNMNNEFFSNFCCSEFHIYNKNNKAIDRTWSFHDAKYLAEHFIQYTKALDEESDSFIKHITHNSYQNSTLDQILAILTLIAIKDYDLAIKRIQYLIDEDEEIIVPGFEEYGDLSERLIKYCYDRMSDNKQ